MTQRKVRLAFAGACLLAITATACSSDDSTSSDSGAPAGSSATDAAGAALTISGNTFSAASVAAATDFTIVNNDSVAHTVTADDGSFDIAVPAGGTATHAIPTAGSFPIHCNIHSSMTGTITVA